MKENQENNSNNSSTIAKANLSNSLNMSEADILKSLGSEENIMKLIKNPKMSQLMEDPDIQKQIREFIDDPNHKISGPIKGIINSFLNTQMPGSISKEIEEPGAESNKPGVAPGAGAESGAVQRVQPPATAQYPTVYGEGANPPVEQSVRYPNIAPANSSIIGGKRGGKQVKTNTSTKKKASTKGGKKVTKTDTKSRNKKI
jgi:hypothetical protein